MLLCLLANAPTVAAEPPWSLFGTQETRNENLGPFRKWTEAVEKTAREKAERPCGVAGLNSCTYQELMKFVGDLKGVRKITQLREINTYLNKAPYVTDPANWNQDDYWESPAEFLAKNGDCEDYAIAKYMSLRQLGWPAASLRIVAVQDLNLKVGHAVLVANLDGTLYLLDNQVKTVIEANSVRHYVPLYSIQEDAWFRHRR